MLFPMSQRMVKPYTSNLVPYLSIMDVRALVTMCLLSVRLSCIVISGVHMVPYLSYLWFSGSNLIRMLVDQRRRDELGHLGTVPQ